MSDAKTLVQPIADIAVLALRSLLWSFLSMVFLGMILAIPSFLIAGKHHTLWGVLAALVSLLASAWLGWLLASKRGTAAGLLAAVKRYQVGTQAVHAVFDRIPRIGDIQANASLLPLAEAERILRTARLDIPAASVEGGAISRWIKRKIQRNLYVEIVQIALTQARTQPAGVDLIKLRDLVAQEANGALIRKLEDGQRVALLFASVLVLLAIGSAFLIRLLSAL
ncbi:MAG: hypothetical protein OEL91_06110 [Burkholderiaceae bacterium]|nr:hypothetical protein [Burkholderiaceae bacterium]